jgi:hypothetical protein
MPFSIPHVYATGTHYEVGFKMGEAMKDRINTYLNDFTDFKAKIVSYIQSEKGKKIFDKYIQNQTKIFPWYVDEIRGIADGSNLPFEWVCSIFSK